MPAGSVADRAAAAFLLIGLGLFFLAPASAGAAVAFLLAMATLVAPRLGLMASLATLPLHLQARSVVGLAVSSSELTLLAAALGFGIRRALALRSSRPPNDWKGTTFDGPIALLLSSALLSLLVTEYLKLSLRELRTLILEPILFYYLLLVAFPPRAILWPVVAVLASSVAISLVGLVGLPFGWGSTEAEGVRRLQAVFPSPNHLGLFLGRALPWLLALAWVDGRWRLPAIVGALVVAAALIATFSLGAWLGSWAAILLLAAALGGRGLLAVTAVGSAVLGVALAALVSPGRIASHFEPGRGTTFFRLQLWQSALAMVRDHPILGIGLDNFLYLYQQRYVLPSALAEANLSHPHNLVIQFWLQLGLLGLGAAFWLLALAFRLAHSLIRGSADRLARALAAGAAASLADFVVHGLIDNSYFLPDLAILFWLTLAVLESVRRLQSPLPGRSTSW